jgi:hypothetical protein
VIARLRIAPSPAVRPPVGEPERHLMRCRRREEAADVLCAVIADGRDASRARLLGCFRLTDSVEVRRVRHGLELTAVFDAEGLERDALERRLLAATNGHAVRFGWARFPDDGLTLQALKEIAR